MMTWRVAGCLTAALVACEPSAEQLPPLGEVLVVVDTDAPVPALVSSLRVDVYDTDGTWLVSEDIFRNDPETWPVSFSIFSRDETTPREVLLRLRAYPDGKVRDYRGETFTPPAAVEDSLEACLAPAWKEVKQLLLRDEELQPTLDPKGEPIVATPLEEPLPTLAIDRLAAVRIEPGVAGALPIVLRSVCFGTEADMQQERTCVDQEKQYVDVTFMPLVGKNEAPNSSVQSTFPGALKCTGPVDADTVCVDGGAFELGDPAVFGFGQFDGFPERVAVIPPLRVDRYEVTVGRFRAALDQSLLDGVPLPTLNDGPLAASPTEPESSRCTFSGAPLSGASSREDYPLNCVSFVTARAFCTALGGDLPTEAQWEYFAAAAGRGRQDRFPWGSETAGCDEVVFGRGAPGLGSTDCQGFGFGVAPVTASETDSAIDVTPVHGLVGLGGNVREWTRDSHRSYCTSCWDAASLFDPVCDDSQAVSRTVRGGDWAAPADRLLSAMRDEGFAPDSRSSRVGFRCVYPNESKKLTPTNPTQEP